jgi:hypothetical protein
MTPDEAWAAIHKAIDALRFFWEGGAPEPEEKVAPPPKKKPAVNFDLEIKKFVEMWNALPSVPKIRRITKQRRHKFTLRLKDDWWRWNWENALLRIKDIPGLCGKNDRGWRANVDWILKPDTVAKILEGQFNEWGQREKETDVFSLPVEGETPPVKGSADHLPQVEDSNEHDFDY